MSDFDIRSDVVLGGRVLHLAGLSDMVWGHVSARDGDGRGAWIKASGLGFEEVTPEDILLVDWEGSALEGRGRPHNEWPIHTEILRARANVGSVVHAHPPNAIALAASGRERAAFRTRPESSRADSGGTTKRRASSTRARREPRWPWRWARTERASYGPWHRRGRRDRRRRGHDGRDA